RHRLAARLLGSVVTVVSVAIVAVICRTRACRRGGSAGYGAQSAADRRADAGATPAAGDRTDDSPGAGAEQTPAERPLTGIVGIRKSRCSHQQSRADRARKSHPLSHSELRQDPATDPPL